MLGHAFSLMAFDQAEEVFTEDFENHADMGSVGTFVTEVI